MATYACPSCCQFGVQVKKKEKTEMEAAGRQKDWRCVHCGWEGDTEDLGHTKN